MTDTKPELLSVTQEDRDAAGKLARAMQMENSAYLAEQGDVDHQPLVQAFARHRLEATARPSLCPDDAGMVEEIERAFKEAYELGYLEGYFVEPRVISLGNEEDREFALAFMEGTSEAWSDYRSNLALSNRAGSKDGGREACDLRRPDDMSQLADWLEYRACDNGATPAFCEMAAAYLRALKPPAVDHGEGGQ